jgi:hypothetical protein
MGDPLRLSCDTPLSVKVGTKFHRQVAVAQSVQFTCKLKATEFVFVCEYEEPFLDVTLCRSCKN